MSSTAPSPVRVGLIGVGGICGFVHYPGLERIPGVDIVALADRNAELLAKRQQEWEVDHIYEDAAQMLSEIKPDAVVIATHNAVHKELIFQALDAGAHVLCEKPLGMDYAETVEIYEYAKRSGKRHMMAFTYRYVPAMNYIRHLIHSGELGEIRHARFQRLQDWGPFAIGWRQYKAMAGSGELGDMGIHRIDFAQDLMGPIRSVTASVKQWEAREQTRDGQTVPPQDVEDWVAWIAEFKSGATGVFEMGKLTRGQGPKGDHDLAEFNGTKGSAAYRLHAPHEVLLAGTGRDEAYKTVPVPAEFLTRPGSPRDPNEGDPNQIFRFDQAWEFISAIREGRDPKPSFYEGMRAQAVADSILLAAAERRWVDVPDVP
ncbi:MAG: Gfo/Idh/MocA family oxidoreductase [Caldilineaceae bacterium]|nr:Gfo/Idh/MocA family oxidoreductase [Caldilineaceae bacterium]